MVMIKLPNQLLDYKSLLNIEYNVPHSIFVSTKNFSNVFKYIFISERDYDKCDVLIDGYNISKFSVNIPLQELLIESKKCKYSNNKKSICFTTRLYGDYIEIEDVFYKIIDLSDIKYSKSIELKYIFDEPYVSSNYMWKKKL